MNARPANARVLGVLEYPGEGTLLTTDARLLVGGWVVGAGSTVRVSASCAGLPAAELSSGLARADVLGSFGHASEAANCGFSGYLDISGLVAGRHTLSVTVHAVAQPGRVQLSWSRELELADADTIYNDWRDRAATAARNLISGAPPTPTALVTWYVRSAGDAPSAVARSLASVLEAGAALCQGRTQTAPTEPCATPYFGVLQAGDLLCADSMAVLAHVLARRPAIEVLYADHDHGNAQGQRTDPVFKPAWSPEFATQPLLWERSFVLRHDRHGCHLPALLADRDAWEAAWAQIFNRSDLPVHHLPWPLTTETTPRCGWTRSASPTAPPVRQRMSAIVPTRMTDPAMLARCLDGLQASRQHHDIDIVVVLNNLDGFDVHRAPAFFSPWQARVLHHEGSFNWSALNNLGVRHAQGDWLLFLNDDVEPLSADWLDKMLAAASRPGVGCVGALLRYPDHSLQHAGVWLDGRCAHAGRHSFRHCTGSEARASRWLQMNREQSAVTGACLLTHRRLFGAVGGFDTALPVVFNDVDFCVRLRQLGWRSVVAAGAELLHHEGVSRTGFPEQADHDHFRARWGPVLPLEDPHRHPCLMHDRDDWSLDPQRLPPDDARP